MWTLPEEEEFFLGQLNKTHRVLEYGSGQSTKQIAERCKSVFSIEHDPKWFNYNVQQNLGHNVVLMHVPPDKPWESRDGSLEEFNSYIHAPIPFGRYDVIFVDGRARVDCCRILDQLAYPDSLIFFHDFGPKHQAEDGSGYRTHYDEVLEWLEVVDSVETMYLFKQK